MILIIYYCIVKLKDNKGDNKKQIKVKTTKDVAKDTFFSALSQLIALTFDPFRYKFIQNKNDHKQLLEDYKNMSEDYFEQLEDHIVGNRDPEIFEYLEEMVNNCPEMAKKLLDEFYISHYKKLEKLREEGKDYFSVQLECNSFVLTRVSHFLKYWDRNPRNYARIWMIYESILKDLEFDIYKESQDNEVNHKEYRVYDESEIEEFDLHSLRIIWITLHEYFTLLEDPQGLGFNSFVPHPPIESVLPNDPLENENGKSSDEHKQEVEDSKEENEKREEEIKLAKKLKDDFYTITDISLKRCNDTLQDASATKNDKSEAKYYGEIMLMYFANHEGNNFTKNYYNIVPKCSNMTERDRQIAIDILVNKIGEADREYIRYYGNLAWLNFGLPKTLENYERTVTMLFLAVTWKRIK